MSKPMNQVESLLAYSPDEVKWLPRYQNGEAYEVSVWLDPWIDNGIEWEPDGWREFYDNALEHVPGLARKVQEWRLRHGLKMVQIASRELEWILAGFHQKDEVKVMDEEKDEISRLKRELLEAHAELGKQSTMWLARLTREEHRSAGLETKLIVAEIDLKDVRARLDTLKSKVKTLASSW